MLKKLENLKEKGKEFYKKNKSEIIFYAGYAAGVAFSIGGLLLTEKILYKDSNIFKFSAGYNPDPNLTSYDGFIRTYRTTRFGKDVENVILYLDLKGLERWEKALKVSAEKRKSILEGK